MFQSLTLIAAVVAAGLAIPAVAQNTAPPSELHPPINLDADTLRARFATSALGLKPGTTKTAPALGLPFGLDYNREVKSLMVPLDEKNEWGVGVGLNMNQSKVIELSPGSALGLQQPNRTPGLTLHKKF